MDPWFTETTKGSFLDVIEHEFRQAVSQALFKDSLLQVFEEIDENKDGLLDMSEIEAKFKALGYGDEEIENFWKLSDIDQDQTLSMHEFLEHFSHFLVLSARK